MPEPIAIFPYRPGSQEEAEHSQPPRRSSEISQEDLTELDEFDAQLYCAGLPSEEFAFTKDFLESNHVTPIEESWRVNTQSAKLMVNYFKTELGQKDLQRIGINIGDSPTISEIKSELATFDWSSLGYADFSQISKSSINWAKTEFVNSFAGNNFENVAGIEEPDFITVLRDPDSLVKKLQGYVEFKHYLVAVKKDLNNLHGDRHSQKTITKLYTWRINNLISEELAGVYDLLANYNITPSIEFSKALKKISQMFNFDYIGVASNPDRVTKYLLQIDAYRNGLNPLGQQLDDLFAHQSNLETELIDGSYFNSQERAKLEETTVDSEDAKEIYEYMLDYYGLLSNMTEIDFDRSGRPSDGKWQVAIDPKRHVLNVDSRKGLIEIPSNRKRNLVKEIAVACHEMAHVFQGENRQQITGIRILNEVGGSRGRVYAEAGGINWERRAMNYLFGRARPAKNGYLEAAKQLQEGKAVTEAIFAYFQTLNKVKSEDDKTLRKYARTAFGSTLRLMSKGGQWRNNDEFLPNSQPLQYAEQELVSRNLSSEELVAGVSPYVISDLESLGLITRSELHIPVELPWTVLGPYVRKKFQTVIA